MLDRLLARLRPQLLPSVSFLVVRDNRRVEINRKSRRISIGATRQWCIENSPSEWISFVDDDDLVPEDYVSRVSDIIADGWPQDLAPDIVGFRLRYFVDGLEAGYAIHSYDAPILAGPPRPRRGFRRYERFPNHLNPVRRELALQVGYKALNTGEDAEYARGLWRLKPRPREVFIDAPMYSYYFVSDKEYEY